MKRSSLQRKLTLWFSAALVLMAVLTFIVVFFVSHSVLQKQLRTELIHTVEDNVDEVEFYRSIAQMDQDGDTDHYIRYGVGYLEIDDDFLDQVNGMITALYHENGSLLYGENPIAAAGMLAFEDGVCRTVRVRGETWYIFDRRLEQNTLRDLWLRGAVPETRADAPLRDIVYVCVWSLLALTLIAMAGAFNGMMQRLDDAFEAERQFASDASHELRTPMAVIMAQCEDALSGEKTGADYREALSVIHRQGRRMNRMISGMLELVRMERKTDHYAREPFNLSALTESVCEDMALICEKNIALTTDVEPDISITGDQTLITRLLGNLIGNAYRYGRENGHIIVTLHRAGSAIELTVSDDGIGIAPDQQKKIFRRLYQGASERSGDGAGLGLAMARQIARLHGGELTVVSEEGKGSAFTARFPMQ